MFHYEDDEVRDLLLTGEIGLEKENLRVTGDGCFAGTPDPFPDDRNIVKDFCENQVEINTFPWPGTHQAIDELMRHTARVRDRLDQEEEQEYLWPFSNPPYLKGEGGIPIAQFRGDRRSKTEYREYLAGKYGRRLMTFSGIHVNFSFSDTLLKRDFELSGESDFRSYKDRIYLNLAEQLLRYGWILNILTAASPIMDGSFFDESRMGEDVITDYASVRSGEHGYWNDFNPVMDYRSTDAYVDSIAEYVSKGLLQAPSELYFPIRLKSGGEYTVEALRRGWNHVELRNFDLNPLRAEGIDGRDVDFLRLLLVWISCREDDHLSQAERAAAPDNFKHAAHLHPEKETVITSLDRGHGREVSMTDEAGRIIREMGSFYDSTGIPVRDIIDFEYDKIAHPDHRYAFRIIDRFSGGFVKKGMAWAKELVGR